MLIRSTDRIYRKSEVLAVLNISKSTLYNRIHDGMMPPPINLGGRACGWLEREIQSVLAAMIAGRTNEEVKTLVSTIIIDRQTATSLEAPLKDSA